MRSHRSLFVALASLGLVAGIVLSSAPARAADESIRGYVTDGTTGAPLKDVCVTLGPPIRCFTQTDANGFYLIDLGALAVQPGTTWDMYFLKSTTHQTAYSDKFQVTGPVSFNQVLMPTGQRELCPTPRADVPTQSVYLPNVTKTLGGATGWQTPFIVQSTGTAAATLEVTYYRFLNGSCAVRRTVSGLLPSTSFADVPNNDTDLPGDTQFAVVVRSYGATVVSVVNEHSGTGDRAEALSYVGVSTGATSVFLPNIVRRFFGYVTPVIIQNLGTKDANVTAKFTSFDGTASDVTVLRQIPAGGSKFIDPNSEPGLVDGKQYTARVTSADPISVVVNTHNDAPTVAAPVAYSTNGIATGATAVYGPYAAKDGGTAKRVSTIVVQNLSQSKTITPAIAFDVLGGSGATTQLMTAPAPVEPGRAWAFDPRFTVGTTTPCSTPSSTCLGTGEYSFVARSNDPDAQIAVAVNVISATNAMGYTALPTPAARIYLPNVTRTLGGATGWTTPILLQTVGATTGATVSWYRFRDGQLAFTQTLDIPAGRGVRIDPRDIAALQDDTQYSVIVAGSGGTVAAIVMELATGGDNAMIYEGFAVQKTP